MISNTWFIAMGVDLLMTLLLIFIMIVAAMVGLRLYATGKRLAGLLGALGAALLGISSFSMPFVIAIFASIDNGKSVIYLLKDIFQEPWFLFAWAGLMFLSALPAGFNSAALWLAAPRNFGSDETEDQSAPNPTETQTP